MSEINNIKSAGQNAVNSNRNVNAHDNRDASKLNGVQPDSTRPDTMSLTGTATQLQAVQQTLADVPEVNAERVEALREVIASGSYKVDANELAQNLIDFEQQFNESG